MFKALADPARLQILIILAEQERNVSEKSPTPALSIIAAQVMSRAISMDRVAVTKPYRMATISTILLMAICITRTAIAVTTTEPLRWSGVKLPGSARSKRLG